MKYLFNIILLGFFLFLFQLCFIFCCEQHATCRECIRDEARCVWCADENANYTKRCKSEVDLGDWCLNYTHNPKNQMRVEKASNFSADKDVGIVQLKPQIIKLDLRPGHMTDFDFSYKRVKDYPLDFYFLLDASLSMKNFKDNVVKQSKSIHRLLLEFTNDIQLGMGTFVDKNALPYTDKVNSTATYSFRHRLKLNNNVGEFEKALNDMEFGMNIDEPEGTLDALAQVMACKKEIGWRNQSRKIIVVNTDASYHTAGHGLQAGIIQPYDGKCYTENGIYTKELEMDYPSPSMINTLAIREGFVTIFLVKNLQRDNYIPLEKAIRGANVTTYTNEALVNDGVPKILKEIYDSISESIKLKYKVSSEYQSYFSINFKPDCSKGNGCPVTINEEKKFKGTIKLKKHLDVDNIPIDITVVGLNEKLRLNVNIIKECDCKTDSNSSSCSHNGDKTCGICECNPGWFSEKCQCSAATSTDDNINSCMANGTLCSDHGYCKCGQCFCIDNFKGQFCECNLQNCLRDSNGELCSDHGSCGEVNCGECSCHDDWTGNDCSCSKLQTDCTHGTQICGGLGECVCNKCICRQPASWDVRLLDHLCQPIQKDSESETEGSQQLQCARLQICVLNFLKDGKSGCDYINVTAVDELKLNDKDDITIITLEQNSTVLGIDEEPEVSETHVWIECSGIRADVGCYTKFVYRYDNNYGVVVKVQTKFDCAETYLMAGGGCLIGIIIIGLLTLFCWKFITNRRDRAEYDRFVKEVQSEDPVLINDIFTPATVSFSNPAFKLSRRSRNE